MAPQHYCERAFETFTEIVRNWTKIIIERQIEILTFKIIVEAHMFPGGSNYRERAFEIFTELTKSSIQNIVHNCTKLLESYDI